MTSEGIDEAVESGGWRRSGGLVSLPESHRSVVVPTTASFWRKLAAFSGPGFLVAVGSLAQACRDHYSKPTVIFLWIACEIAIAACDLAEVVGSAIALQLLFGIPLVWGCVITAADVLVILYLQYKGFRRMEAIVVVLISTIALCFASELLSPSRTCPMCSQDLFRGRKF